MKWAYTSHWWQLAAFTLLPCITRGSTTRKTDIETYHTIRQPPASPRRWSSASSTKSLRWNQFLSCCSLKPQASLWPQMSASEMRVSKKQYRNELIFIDNVSSHLICSCNSQSRSQHYRAFHLSLPVKNRVSHVISSTSSLVRPTIFNETKQRQLTHHNHHNEADLHRDPHGCAFWGQHSKLQFWLRALSSQLHTGADGHAETNSGSSVRTPATTFTWASSVSLRASSMVAGSRPLMAAHTSSRAAAPGPAASASRTIIMVRRSGQHFIGHGPWRSGPNMNDTCSPDHRHC